MKQSESDSGHIDKEYLDQVLAERRSQPGERWLSYYDSINVFSSMLSALRLPPTAVDFKWAAEEVRHAILPWLHGDTHWLDRKEHLDWLPIFVGYLNSIEDREDFKLRPSRHRRTIYDVCSPDDCLSIEEDTRILFNTILKLAKKYNLKLMPFVENLGKGRSDEPTPGIRGKQDHSRRVEWICRILTEFYAIETHSAPSFPKSPQTKPQTSQPDQPELPFCPAEPHSESNTDATTAKRPDASKPKKERYSGRSVFDGKKVHRDITSDSKQKNIKVNGRSFSLTRVVDWDIADRMLSAVESGSYATKEGIYDIDLTSDEYNGLSKGGKDFVAYSLDREKLKKQKQGHKYTGKARIKPDLLRSVV